MEHSFKEVHLEIGIKYFIHLSFLCCIYQKLFYLFLIVVHAIAKQKRDSVSDSLLLAKSSPSPKQTSTRYDPNLVPLHSDIEEEGETVHKEAEND